MTCIHVSYFLSSFISIFLYLFEFFPHLQFCCSLLGLFASSFLFYLPFLHQPYFLFSCLFFYFHIFACQSSIESYTNYFFNPLVCTHNHFRTPSIFFVKMLRFISFQVFDRIKRERPKMLEKVFAIAGDCVESDFGLSETDRKKLLEEVNCVFHCAATVRFDEKIRTAVNINVRATRDLLAMAREMKHLTVI